MDIGTVCNQFSPEFSGDDVRSNWPHYFTMVCKCYNNSGGYDCGDCEFGWKGDDCLVNETRRRLPIEDIPDTEWIAYKNTLFEAKRTISTRYVVLADDAVPGDANAVINSTRNITIYDLFVWYHHYVAKENGKPML